MIISLREQKQRIGLNEYAYYNDFSNILHFEYKDRIESVAINLGGSNWTVSPAGEVAFMYQDNEGDSLAVIDPVRHRRVFQKLPRTRILNLLLDNGTFYAAMNGFLISGNRDGNGALLTRGRKTIESGAQFMFCIDDAGKLVYTRRGSCRRFVYDPETKRRESFMNYQTMWRFALFDSFKNRHIPDVPEERWDIRQMLKAMKDFSAYHVITPNGIRLYALLKKLEEWHMNDAEELDALLGMDWNLQCRACTNELFPSQELLENLFRVSELSELDIKKVLPVSIQRWSSKFEKPATGRRAKVLNEAEYEDIYINGGIYMS